MEDTFSGGILEEEFVIEENSMDGFTDLEFSEKGKVQPIKSSSIMGPWEPCISLVFEEWEDAMSCYGAYAKTKGFSIRINRTRRSLKDKSVIGAEFSCYREGFCRPSYHKKRKNGTPCYETMIGCKAMLSIRRDDEKWVVEAMCGHTPSVIIMDDDKAMANAIAQRLRFLLLNYNFLIGTLPSALSNYSSLLHLSTEGNSLSSVVPSSIGALPHLRVIFHSHNNLSDSLPSSVFCNITEFDILGNSFSGSIPDSIGSLSRLEELKMSNNMFDGVVPVGITNCSLLRVLDLQGNRLTGGIPAFISELRGLTALLLGGNGFSSSIPSSYGNLTALETLG
ncbi:hypothetical protein RHGRI_019489 [Rhododendron griersonianum]|uniref:FAR1 domain-containing protein n=1 Tax=Rhododendron griersonianum TaxID=479676 RepID=A0AAV6JEY0_9ERIC|nr:hypothetical protein RHGRI_019489 [Rhododendron griersonianum]